jgi:hypothetical protein
VGVVLSGNQGPKEMEYDLGTPLGNLLMDIPNNGKTRIALIVPVWNLLKEEAETLSLPPANKQAKSPTSVAIPKRGGGRGKGGKGGRGGQKPYVKKEAIKDDEEEKAIVVEEEEEEVEEDSDFPEANEIVTCKRKTISNSMYLADCWWLHT